MPTPPTDTDASPTDTGHPTGYLGSAEVRIDVDPDTYERLRAEYRCVVEHGYSAGFDTFAFNYCSTSEFHVTVDGERVEPDTPWGGCDP